MKIKDKLLLTTITLALVPAITIGIVFYIININTLKRQIESAHYEAVSAVDTLIFVVVSDMVNISFTATPKIAEFIEKKNYQAINEKLNLIDQMNDPNIGTGRGLGYHVSIVTDENGNILARSNVIEGVKKEISQKGHIFYLDEEKTKKWDYPENLGIALSNVLKGKLDARKIIYNQEFLRREGYEHLIDKYGFKEMMGLTAFQPIFNQENKQIGVLILITILNNNQAAIGAINAITGTEFTAITPAGEIMSSFFINPPVPTLEIIEKAKQRAEEMRKGIKDKKGKDSVFYTKERIYLKSCPEKIIFKDGEGVCYVAGKIIPYEKLEERTYRFHFISEVDPNFKYVSIRGIAYDLTDHDLLINAQIIPLIITFLITFLFISALALILAKKGTDPILKFTKEIQEIEKEGFSKKIDIKTGDEIEILIHSFNNMSKKIAQNYKEIEEQKDVLAIRVEAKTKELKELADGLEKQVKEKTKDLQKRVDELEKFHNATIDRELKMIELKKEITELKERLKDDELRSS